jgi:hypothetical protein
MKDCNFIPHDESEEEEDDVVSEMFNELTCELL